MRRARRIDRRCGTHWLAIAVCVAVSLGGLQRVAAESWPTKAIKAISPISAGSAVDVVSRVVLEQVSAQLGWPIVVENRPGADGTIGSAVVARADPDGYTILAHSAAQAIVAASNKVLPYDTYRDFARVTPIAKIPSVLVVASAANIRSIDELKAAAHSRPISFASPGPFNRLNTERFLRSVGVEAQRIPFKGAPEALNEVVAGRVDLYFSPLSSAVPLIQAGKALGLAVTGSQRTPMLPGVPTFAEIGFAKADDNFWMGIFVPGRTPYSIIDSLYRATVLALAEPVVKHKLTTMGAEPMTASPAQFDVLLREQISETASLIRALGGTFD